MMEVSGISKKRFSKGKIIFICGALLLVVSAAAAGYFFWQYSRLKADPSLTSQETTKRLTSEVGKIYALPGDEDPTVALVQDKDKLKDQAFFSKAENNDYILIYTKAKLALLYREKENRLINVGPITISDSATPTPAATTPPATKK